jgi:hypothetical protein
MHKNEGWHSTRRACADWLKFPTGTFNKLVKLPDCPFLWVVQGHHLIQGLWIGASQQINVRNPPTCMSIRTEWKFTLPKFASRGYGKEETSVQECPGTEYGTILSMIISFVVGKAASPRCFKIFLAYSVGQSWVMNRKKKTEASWIGWGSKKLCSIVRQVVKAAVTNTPEGELPWNCTRLSINASGYSCFQRYKISPALNDEWLDDV